MEKTTKISEVGRTTININTGGTQTVTTDEERKNNDDTPDERQLGLRGILIAIYDRIFRD